MKSSNVVAAGMVPCWCRAFSFTVFLVTVGVVPHVGVNGQLAPNYYALTCGNVEGLVRTWLVANLFTDPTGPAAIVRMLFHDCQVNGCEGSVLLDSQPGIVSEMVSDANFGIRDQRFIDSIKLIVELACPNTVSCADILALAARDCVNIAGGPNIPMLLGRKDGISASNLDADRQLPPVTLTVTQLFNEFAAMGMSETEAIAILGAHTIGVGHCVNVVDRIYPTVDPFLVSSMASQLSNSCPSPNPATFNNNTILANDGTNLFFDNQYFKDVMAGKGLFKIDSNIALDPRSLPIVNQFALNQQYFFQQFETAFIKMSNHRVLLDGQGEVRKNCRMVNP